MNRFIGIPVAALVVSGIAAFVIGWRRDQPPSRNARKSAANRDAYSSDWAELLASFRL